MSDTVTTAGTLLTRELELNAGPVRVTGVLTTALVDTGCCGTGACSTYDITHVNHASVSHITADAERATLAAVRVRLPGVLVRLAAVCAAALLSACAEQPETLVERFARAPRAADAAACTDAPAGVLGWAPGTPFPLARAGFTIDAPRLAADGSGLTVVPVRGLLLPGAARPEQRVYVRVRRRGLFGAEIDLAGTLADPFQINAEIERDRNLDADIVRLLTELQSAQNRFRGKTGRYARAERELVEAKALRAPVQHPKVTFEWIVETSDDRTRFPVRIEALARVREYDDKGPVLRWVLLGDGGIHRVERPEGAPTAPIRRPTIAE